MARPTDPSRELLFGLLALQTGLIGAPALVAAFHAWTQDKGRPLGGLLVAQGALDDEACGLVRGLVGKHLAAHDGDAAGGLAALDVAPAVRTTLGRAGGPDVEATLARLPTGVGSAARGGDVTADFTTGPAGQRFLVLRPHAKGGLGAVSVALDTELNREVALKQILDRHADDPSSRQRFVLEAEITGGLEHPGIVPVYGLGADADGRPYYAMRFIKGDPLKEAVERFHSDEALRGDAGARSLALRNLLRRFVDVCNAVEYAHSRGVIHRDIKPSNVIVGKYGETLVVDWGLAKATGRSDPGSGERTLAPGPAGGSAETMPGSALGTPAYMSPEQAEGDLDRLGPRSDVYSLGATLYCLLTGRPPFEGEVAAVLRAVRAGAFPPPRRVDPGVAPALEAVCLKAMARQADRRYPTPKALAGDVERWTAGEPVGAWREPWRVRARRALARHQTLAAGCAAAAAVALLAFATVAGLERRSNRALAAKNLELGRSNAREVRARDRAEENYRLARRAVDDYLTRVSEDRLINVPGLQPLRKGLLESARRFYQEFLDRRGDEPGLQAEAAHASLRLGAVADLVESHARALEHFRKARALFEALDRPGSDPAVVLDGLIEADTRIGSALLESGRLTEALAAYRRALDGQERLTATAPGSAAGRSALAATLRDVALAEQRVGRADDALRDHRRALALRAGLAADHPGVPGYRAAQADSLATIGYLLQQLGRADEAIESFRRACDLLRGVVAADPAVSRHAEDLARNLGNLGGLLRRTGRPAEAQANLRESLAAFERLAAENPRVTAYRVESAVAANMVGDLVRDTGRLDESLALARKALDVEERLLAESPEVAPYRANAAKSLSNIARVELARGRPDDALGHLLRAAGLLESVRERDAYQEYNLACYRALAAPLAGADRDALAARAVVGLNRTAARGFRVLEAFRDDPDLRSLHDRPDFQALLMDLALPADPFAARR